MTRKSMLSLLVVLMLAVPGAAAMGAGNSTGQPEDFGHMIRRLSEGWQQVSFSQEPGKAEWKRYEMKPGAEGYDGLVFKVPPGEPRDLFWAFITPDHSSMQCWYIMAKDPNEEFNGFIGFWQHTAGEFTGTDLPQHGTIILQALMDTGTMLQPNKEYIMRLQYGTPGPEPLWATMALLPHGKWAYREASVAQVLGLKPTQLPLACRLGLTERVAELIKADPASVNALDQYGMPPLDIAGCFGYPDMVNLLLDHGAQLNELDRDSMTPLLSSLNQGRPECATLLIQRGADVNTPDRQGRTPLHVAVQTKAIPVVRLLCEHKADLAAHIKGQPYDGCTPLHIAADALDAATARLLLENKAPADAKDAKGRTALHWAAAYGDAATVQALFDGGAEVNAPDRRGFTPLDYAVKDNHPAVATLLRKHGGKEAASPDLNGYPEEDMGPCWAFFNPDSYLIVPGSPSLSPKDSFTVELWVNAWHLPSGTVDVIDRDGDKPGPYRIVLGHDGLLGAGAAGMTWMKIAPGPDNGPLPLNQWVHLALVCDGKTTRIYANGKKVGDYDCYGSITGTANPLRIGAPVDKGAGFLGMVREVRVSKSVRYTEDFKPAWRFSPDADTVLLLHCNEGNGSMLRDSSGQHNDAFAANGAWWWLLP